MGVKFKVAGVDKVVRNLKSLEPKIQAKAVRKATRAGAKVLAAEVKEIAPVDTGELRDSIKVKDARRRRRGQLMTVVKAGAGKVKGVQAHGPAVEFGTSRKPPVPFMAPALDAKGGEARDVAIEELGRAIDQILRSMSISGRLEAAGKKLAKTKVYKSAVRKAKRARRSARRLSKGAARKAVRISKRARRSAARAKKRTSKLIRKSAKRRRK
jgi:HK97 gp10 family phage protein